MGQDIPLQRDLGLGTDRVDAGAIDRLRAEVRQWRNEGWPKTSNNRELLEYWSREPGEGPVYSLFYANERRSRLSCS